jgi:cellulose synthase (UDP-forming)
MSEPLGTLVNVAWVAFDLVVLSVLVKAVLYKGFVPENGPEHGGPERPEERKADAV